jgi:pyruvate dehydrogenase E2 component (dihydrolipoamide acetyltransferase)
VTLTALMAKAIGEALGKFPQFNASVDMRAEEIIFKRYVNIGIAVDTDRGLLVPVIRDVDRKDVPVIADELAQLAQKARDRKLLPDEMRGGGFTISNLGSLKAGSFAPIINWPEVAILGVSRATMQPVYVDGHFEPRLLMPLSLSYDHRVIDGADGARFMRWLVEALEQPALLWMNT